MQSLFDDGPPATRSFGVTKMPISEFARAGRIVRIRSAVLGCDVILASDNVDEATLEIFDLPVYRAREFKHLLGADPDELKLIHASKVQFGGELVSA